MGNCQNVRQENDTCEVLRAVARVGPVEVDAFSVMETGVFGTLVDIYWAVFPFPSYGRKYVVVFSLKKRIINKIFDAESRYMIWTLFVFLYISAILSSFKCMPNYKRHLHSCANVHCTHINLLNIVRHIIILKLMYKVAIAVFFVMSEYHI